MMSTTNLAKTLLKLAQLDIDAINAYQQALDNIDDKTIHSDLKKFQQDHKQHVADLSVEIKKLGETPPESADIKGFLIEGFTAIRSMTGTEGALKAMKGNEELTTKTYNDALKETLPANIRTLVEKNYADEKRHLAYIQLALKTELA